jgi:hypothetical protein
VVVPLADPSLFENALMSMIRYLTFPGLPARVAAFISPSALPLVTFLIGGMRVWVIKVMLDLS